MQFILASLASHSLPAQGLLLVQPTRTGEPRRTETSMMLSAPASALAGGPSWSSLTRAAPPSRSRAPDHHGDIMWPSRFCAEGEEEEPQCAPSSDGGVRVFLEREAKTRHHHDNGRATAPSGAPPRAPCSVGGASTGTATSHTREKRHPEPAVTCAATSRRVVACFGRPGGRFARGRRPSTALATTRQDAASNADEPRDGLGSHLWQGAEQRGTPAKAVTREHPEQPRTGHGSARHRLAVLARPSDAVGGSCNLVCGASHPRAAF